VIVEIDIFVILNWWGVTCINMELIAHILDGYFMGKKIHVV
jgi:hypothetical protein